MNKQPSAALLKDSHPSLKTSFGKEGHSTQAVSRVLRSGSSSLTYTEPGSVYWEAARSLGTSDHVQRIRPSCRMPRPSASLSQVAVPPSQTPLFLLSSDTPSQARAPPQRQPNPPPRLPASSARGTNRQCAARGASTGDWRAPQIPSGGVSDPAAAEAVSTKAGDAVCAADAAGSGFGRRRLLLLLLLLRPVMFGRLHDLAIHIYTWFRYSRGRYL